MLRLLRTIRLGLKNLLLHKLRSLLTMLGIVFGVFSVIAMLAIGEGASRQAQRQVLELGATNIIVISQKPAEGSKSNNAQTQVLQYGILRDDYRRIKQTVNTIVDATPIREFSQPARYMHRNMDVRLVGCTPNYFSVNHLNMDAGRFISYRDQEDTANVCVIGHEVATTLFPGEEPRGKSIRIGDVFYSIVGMTSHRTASAAIGGSMSGQDFDKDVYIPLDTLQSRIGDEVMIITAGSRSSEKVELSQITFRVADAKDVVPTANVIRETLARYHADSNDVDLVVPMELLKQAEQLKVIFNVVLGAIALISLVVGGIGIMNIMLATVTERTREIGIRRALGAKRGDITEQFLTETSVLAGTGGLLGVSLGLLTPVAFSAIRWLAKTAIMDSSVQSSSKMFQMFDGLEPVVAWWTLAVAFGISVFIGILSGIYPALAAAKLDPIEALRHE
ncbi:Macrolide export ATP-binding/permease protein MacB [Symmachiella macrocystis]|uniref:Macrolide export ATP-binding/permease protein MacB n=1 Tax=Symmachiella macrocystis TaxID=2527985 RepID=A0A5C6BQY9_9PLAN|nr:ABC transporter permease [Symmachiella macrocystis]TWU14670.1 Macrolide export ATP-binding/permease protein MacB [Symmachiella macrocystis]